MLVKCKVIAGRLEDKDPLNREEAARCVSALIAYMEEKGENESSLNAPKDLLLQKLVLHMDDQSQEFRNLVGKAF